MQVACRWNRGYTQVTQFLQPRTQSHKSLQCEVIVRPDAYETDHPIKLTLEQSREKVLSRIRSQENFSGKTRTRENSKMLIPSDLEHGALDRSFYEKDIVKYPSRLEISRSKMRHMEDDRFPEYPPVPVPTRSCVDPYRNRPPDYRDYDREMRRHYEDEKKRYYEQRTSRSFDVHKEGYDEDRHCRRTVRSDTNKLRRVDERDKRCDEMGKYYDEKPAKYYDEKPVGPRARNNVSKDRRWRHNVDRCDRNSVASREDDYRDRDRERERDRYSERERDSGMSAADGETSTVSGRSNYLKVVKVCILECHQIISYDIMKYTGPTGFNRLNAKFGNELCSHHNEQIFYYEINHEIAKKKSSAPYINVHIKTTLMFSRFL